MCTPGSVSSSMCRSPNELCSISSSLSRSIGPGAEAGGGGVFICFGVLFVDRALFVVDVCRRGGRSVRFAKWVVFTRPCVVGMLSFANAVVRDRPLRELVRPFPDGDA